MRARFIPCLVVLTIFLSGCTNNNGQMGIISPGLLPEEYTLKQAEVDGCFVVQNTLAVEEGGILSGQASWDRFLERSQAGEAAFVRMLFCREDEDGSFQPSPSGVFDLIYDGSGYTVYYNDGDFTIEGTDLYGRRYDHLLALGEVVQPGDTHYVLCLGRAAQSGGQYTHFVLTDDRELTPESYMDWRGPLYAPNSHTGDDMMQHMRLISFYIPDDSTEF